MGRQQILAATRANSEHSDANYDYKAAIPRTHVTFDGASNMSTIPDKPVTILDHIDNIAVPGDVFREPANEFWALICLRDGMEFLYHQAQTCDQAVRQQVNPEGNLRFSGGGNLPSFSQIPKTLLTCAFHWYAISACQYVKTVGAIAHKLDASRPLPKEYAQTIIPEVVAFRNKVAAHFAWTTKNKHDNDAERLASILPPLVFTDDSFFVGAMRVTRRRAGTVTHSDAIQPWSLCKVHESLRDRYWPQPADSTEPSNPGKATTEPQPE